MAYTDSAITTHYGLHCPGIEPQWGRDFPHPSRPAVGPTQPPVVDSWSHSREVMRWGRGMTTHPHIVPTLKKECSYTSTLPVPHHGLLQDELYLLSHTASDVGKVNPAKKRVKLLTKPDHRSDTTPTELPRLLIIFITCYIPYNLLCWQNNNTFYQSDIGTDKRNM